MKNDERAAAVCRELKQGKMSIAELQKRTGIADYTLRYVLGELTREGRVERCGYQSGRKIYCLASLETHAVYEKERTGGIMPAELSAVKQWAKPGKTVRNWELAEETGYSLSSVNGCLKSMLKEGILETDHPLDSPRAIRVPGMIWQEG